mmetsp:Transcript_22368/g.50765  ORF Transcript_22368/g.50765 Transcript_22368/m.50765 type:complete len:80 (+) Transcript_22368:634-873(+)
MPTTRPCKIYLLMAAVLRLGKGPSSLASGIESRKDSKALRREAWEWANRSNRTQMGSLEALQSPLRPPQKLENRNAFGI